MGINHHGTVFVWGFNKGGLLGLGYNLTEVDTPTELIRNIKELSISENHAVAIDLYGDIYSWGSGKYGELCQEKIIYSPIPSKKNSIYEHKNNNMISLNNSNLNIKDKKYKNVFCSNLLTCFIDEEGKFSYYGLIIRLLSSSDNASTIKTLLKDENNSDPNILFREKIVYELENEKFLDIAIGNGFLGLLSEKGIVYTIDQNENINSLYSKFCVNYISISNNKLFGLCIDINQKINNNGIDKTDGEIGGDQNNNNSNQKDFFFCKWIPKYIDNLDSWNTYLYRLNFKEKDYENISLLNTNNKDILLFMKNHNSKYFKKDSINMNYNLNDDKSKSNIKEGSNIYDNLNNTSEYYRKNSMSLFENLTNSENLFNLLNIFDDTYNIKFKRIKNNYHGLKNLSLDKNNILNNILRIDNERLESFEISPKINKSISKNNNGLNAKNFIIDPSYFNTLNENNNENIILNKKKNFKLSTISNNNSGMDSNVNYLLSPEEILNQKNFVNFNKIENYYKINSTKNDILNLEQNFDFYKKNGDLNNSYCEMGIFNIFLLSVN